MSKKNEMNYFDVMITAVSYSHQTAVKLNELLHDLTDVHEKALAIHALEHAADQECHRMMDALNVAFITPIDREDIYDMISSIDDITDLIEDVSNRFDMLSIGKVRPEALQMGAYIETATRQLSELLQAFKSFKKNKVRIHELVMSVNSLEEDGDRLYREFVKQLFLNEKDVLEIIKWKDVFDDMENVLDACEDVADVVGAVCMKHN
jgi:uncharacterized protein